MSETDLVTRLRTTRLLSQRNQMALQAEAAAEIERLRAALAPFAEAADVNEECPRDDGSDDRIWIQQSYGVLLNEITDADLTAARDAYAGTASRPSHASEG